MAQSFNPRPDHYRPCWHCAHDEGERTRSGHIICWRDVRIGSQRHPIVHPLPERGCAHWEREPGADDDLPVGPAGSSAAKPPQPDRQ